MTTIETVTLPRSEAGNDPNDYRNDPDFLASLVPKKAMPNLTWTGTLIPTIEEIEMLSDPEWVYPNLIIKGHVIAIPAPPNGGKTTIFAWIAGQIATQYQVYYVNADTSGSEAKAMYQEASANGYAMLLPDMKAGKSMDDVVLQLENMNAENADYTGIVFIFDTLKKMTDVINKSKAKQLLKTLRGLSAKGMTIVLLAHTNKYNDAEGKPIYEGTGDLRADVDELIYLVPRKNDDGTMTVSTLPDKVRGDFKPITFTITRERDVIPLDEFVDVAAITQKETQREKDSTVIEAIVLAIKDGKVKRREILQSCKDAYGIGWRTVDRVLNAYRKPPVKLWRKENAMENNSSNYYLLGDND